MSKRTLKERLKGRRWADIESDEDLSMSLAVSRSRVLGSRFKVKLPDLESSRNRLLRRWNTSSTATAKKVEPAEGAKSTRATFKFPNGFVGVIPPAVGLPAETSAVDTDTVVDTPAPTASVRTPPEGLVVHVVTPRPGVKSANAFQVACPASPRPPLDPPNAEPVRVQRRSAKRVVPELISSSPLHSNRINGIAAKKSPMRLTPITPSPVTPRKIVVQPGFQSQATQLLPPSQEARVSSAPDKCSVSPVVELEVKASLPVIQGGSPNLAENRQIPKIIISDESVSQASKSASITHSGIASPSEEILSVCQFGSLRDAPKDETALSVTPAGGGDWAHVYDQPTTSVTCPSSVSTFIDVGRTTKYAWPPGYRTIGTAAPADSYYSTQPIRLPHPTCAPVPPPCVVYPHYPSENDFFQRRVHPRDPSTYYSGIHGSVSHSSDPYRGSYILNSGESKPTVRCSAQRSSHHTKAELGVHPLNVCHGLPKPNSYRRYVPSSSDICQFPPLGVPAHDGDRHPPSNATKTIRKPTKHEPNLEKRKTLRSETENSNGIRGGGDSEGEVKRRCPKSAKLPALAPPNASENVKNASQVTASYIPPPPPLASRVSATEHVYPPVAIPPLPAQPPVPIGRTKKSKKQKKSAKPKKVPNADPTITERSRLRQIERVRASKLYQRYISKIPINARTAMDPRTPLEGLAAKPHRDFMDSLNAWKKQLHVSLVPFGPPSPRVEEDKENHQETGNAVSICDRSDLLLRFAVEIGEGMLHQRKDHCG